MVLIPKSVCETKLDKYRIIPAKGRPLNDKHTNIHENIMFNLLLIRGEWTVSFVSIVFLFLNKFITQNKQLNNNEIICTGLTWNVMNEKVV